MSMVDDGVGRVLAALDGQGLSQETLVIFTADHGFSLGHNGFWGHGQATWPANAHRAAFSIPLLMRQPGRIQPLQSSSLMVSQIDLFATLLDYAGVDAEPSAPSPARTLAPLLDGRPLAWDDDAVFMEQEETRAIRTRRWLYMKRFQGSPQNPFQDELYDLVADPEERVNRVDDPELAEVAAGLRARIDDFFDRYRDPRFDLWRGGAAKSNSDKPWLWRDAWGEGWGEVF